MHICPRCWKKFEPRKKLCDTCHIHLVKEADIASTHVEPHFKVTKSGKGKHHRDHITHEILNFDEKKGHEFSKHPHSREHRSIVSQKLKKLFFGPIVMVIIFFAILIAAAFIVSVSG